MRDAGAPMEQTRAEAMHIAAGFAVIETRKTAEYLSHWPSFERSIYKDSEEGF